LAKDAGGVELADALAFAGDEVGREGFGREFGGAAAGDG
jgi:hypothetical protein